MVPAHRVLPAVLAGAIRQAPLTPEKVQFAWRQAVGPVVERSTTIRLDDEGVLRVSAADGHWAREVERSSRLILQRLEALLGQNVVRWVDVQAPGRVSRGGSDGAPRPRARDAGSGSSD
jgi:predicted nucleic acid-binding Zn ribbon protein